MSAPRLRGVFVMGTDTAVGKTIVAVALARWAANRGLRPIPYKPVETGCVPHPADAQRLRIAARANLSLAEICPYPLPLPAAPARAAAAVGVTLTLDHLDAHAHRLARHGDGLIVEAAGGLLVPLHRSETNADLAVRLGLPVVLVARTALGTVNHSALTLLELQRRGLTLAGLIFVRTEPNVAPHEEGNDDLVAALTGVRSVGTFPAVSQSTLADPDALATALATAIGSQTLVRWLVPPASG